MKASNSTYHTVDLRLTMDDKNKARHMLVDGVQDKQIKIYILHQVVRSLRVRINDAENLVS